MRAPKKIPRWALDRIAYDPETGIVTWSNGRYAGRVAGSKPGKSNRRFMTANMRGPDGVHRFLVSRLVWTKVNGAIPRWGFIDHANRNPNDNRLCNLRLATRAQNNANRGLMKNNILGVRGVRREKRGGDYYARLVVGGKSFHLGRFSTIEAASEARVAAEKRLLGEFAPCSSEAK